MAEPRSALQRSQASLARQLAQLADLQRQAEARQGQAGERRAIVARQSGEIDELRSAFQIAQSQATDSRAVSERLALEYHECRTLLEQAHARIAEEQALIERAQIRYHNAYPWKDKVPLAQWARTTALVFGTSCDVAMFAVGACGALPKELAAAKKILGPQPSEEGIQDLVWAIALVPEFQLIY